MAENEDSASQTTEEIKEYTPGSAAVDISPDKDGGVFKEIKREGSDAFGSPQTGDKVSVHYVGTLTNGEKFDSSRDRGDYFEFTLGKGQVIKAWDIGVASMKKDELAILTCKAPYAYGESGSPPKIPPNATLIFEVELFDWKGEDLSPESDNSIQKSVIQKGDGFSSPNEGATCHLHVIGQHDGRVFEDKEVTFVIGEAQEIDVITGIEIAVQKFKKGEKGRLKIHAKHAYGTEGKKEYDIPPNANLDYIVTLKDFEKGKEAWEMDTSEKLEQSNILKQKGTGFFKTGKYALAQKSYKKIVDFLEGESSWEGGDAEKRQALLLAAHLNMAMCHLKLNDNVEAKASCDKALELDPDNEKGLFRRGSASQNMQNFEDALADFHKVLEIDPANKAAKNQIKIIETKIRQAKEKEKQIYGGMFKKFADIDTKREKAAQKEQPKAETEENGVGEESVDEMSAEDTPAVEQEPVTEQEVDVTA